MLMGFLRCIVKFKILLRLAEAISSLLIIFLSLPICGQGICKNMGLFNGVVGESSISKQIEHMSGIFREMFKEIN